MIWTFLMIITMNTLKRRTDFCSYLEDCFSLPCFLIANYKIISLFGHIIMDNCLSKQLRK